MKRLANIVRYWFKRPKPQLVYRVIGDTLVAEEHHLTWRGLWVGKEFHREKIVNECRPSGATVRYGTL